MTKNIIIGAILGAILALIGGVAFAQYPAPERGGYEPRIPGFDWFDRDAPNPTLVCDTSKRVNRRGELVWLQMTCRAAR